MRASKRLPVLLFILLLLAVAIWLAYHFLQTLPSRVIDESQRRLQLQAKTLRDQFFAVTNFQPVVRVKNHIVFEKTVEIAELAIISRPTEVTREFVHTWAGSTKKLRLRGTFQVRSGFDLRKRFEIVVDEAKTRILLPSAEILSVEQTDLTVEAFENGFWNAISAQDIQTETKALRDLARQRNSRLNAEAEANLQSRLRTILGNDVEIIIEPSLPKQPPPP